MKAAAGSFSIAPQTEVDLGSAFVGDLHWEGTQERIECNILVLWPTPDQAPVIICSLDALYAGEAIRETIHAETPATPAENIWVVASHTHRAPMLDASKPRLGRVDPSHLETVLAKLRQLLRRLLAAERKTVDIEIGEQQAAHSVNRRRRQILAPGRPPKIMGTALAPNPSGPVDESVTVVRLREEGGRDLAVIWSYSCHPVGSPYLNAVSGHYPTVVREDIRASVGLEGLPVLFMQGFSGNSRPSGTVVDEERMFRRLILGRTKFGDMNHAVYRKWCSSLSGVALMALNAASKIETSDVACDRIEVPGSEFGDIERSVSFQKISFANDLVILGISAEPVVEYSRFVSDISPYRYNLTVGCIDVPFGYIPTDRQLREGGYEARGFVEYFGIGRLHRKIENVVRENIVKLLV